MFLTKTGKISAVRSAWGKLLIKDFLYPGNPEYHKPWWLHFLKSKCDLFSNDPCGLGSTSLAQLEKARDLEIISPRYLTLFSFAKHLDQNGNGIFWKQPPWHSCFGSHISGNKTRAVLLLDLLRSGKEVKRRICISDDTSLSS